MAKFGLTAQLGDEHPGEGSSPTLILVSVLSGKGNHPLYVQSGMKTRPFGCITAAFVDRLTQIVTMGLTSSKQMFIVRGLTVADSTI
jgi:hypothetical protein